MTCPACLCLAHGGDDAAGEPCPLQHLGVRDLVLPADVEDADTGDGPDGVVSHVSCKKTRFHSRGVWLTRLPFKLGL